MNVALISFACLATFSVTDLKGLLQHVKQDELKLAFPRLARDAYPETDDACKAKLSLALTGSIPQNRPDSSQLI